MLLYSSASLRPSALPNGADITTNTMQVLRKLVETNIGSYIIIRQKGLEGQKSGQGNSAMSSNWYGATGNG